MAGFTLLIESQHGSSTANGNRSQHAISITWCGRRQVWQETQLTPNEVTTSSKGGPATKHMSQQQFGL
jgi:hypothetical protein